MKYNQKSVNNSEGNDMFYGINNFLILADDAAADPMGMITSIGMLVLMVGVFYFFLIRPQRKKDKVAKEMRNNLQAGDEIVTIGGIAGKILSLKEDSVIIETGSDKNKLRIMRWAIQSREEKISN